MIFLKHRPPLIVLHPVHALKKIASRDRVKDSQVVIKVSSFVRNPVFQDS